MALGGCAASSTAIAKRDLVVQSKMSDTIFLDPVAPDQRTVFVQVRNTSDRPELDLAPAVRQSLEQQGYRVVEDPAAAQYWLQANVLQVAVSERSAADAVYGTGFGGPLLGGAVGGGVGYVIGKTVGGSNLLLATGGILLGAAVETITSAFVKDVVFTVVTDVQIAERTTRRVAESETAALRQGSSGEQRQESSGTADMKRFRTRVVSTAEKANLDWPEAAPQLVAGVSRNLAGIL